MQYCASKRTDIYMRRMAARDLLLPREVGPMSSQRFHIAYVYAPGNLVPAAGTRVVGPTAALGTK
jgi:hypothetical protein